MKFIYLASAVLFGLVTIANGSFDNKLNSVQLLLYYGPTFESRTGFSLDEATRILTSPKFDHSKKTVLYVHGYLENQDYESIHVIVNAYLQRGDHNILILDWADLAKGKYILNAVPNALLIGKEMAQIIVNLFDAGLNRKNFHLVGHSLGGQMSGVIGRNVISISKNRIILPRISALDPANPPFYFNIFMAHLSSRDAEFVDVIHTDRLVYGAPIATGTVDFWPNTCQLLFIQQPGCPTRSFIPLSENDLCSHCRSWRFWAESVQNKDPLKNFNVDLRNPKFVMGINCPNYLKGSYCLNTKSESPFAKGMAGVIL